MIVYVYQSTGRAGFETFDYTADQLRSQCPVLLTLVEFNDRVRKTIARDVDPPDIPALIHKLTKLSNPMFFKYIDTQNYAQAHTFLDDSLADGDITQTEKDMLDTCMPT